MESVSSMSTTPNPPSSRAPQPHQRNYQACLQCRRRKVRCDLGPVDNPHEPPCVRCRRESKECIFSATRRKRKTTDSEDALEEDFSDYEIRNSRKRTRSTPEPGSSSVTRRPEPIQTTHGNTTSPYGSAAQLPLTPGGSVARYQPLRRPPAQQSPTNEEDIQRFGDQAAAILQTKEVYSGHDALNLLFEAAGRNGDIEQHHRTGSGSSSTLHRPLLSATTPGSQNNVLSPQSNGTRAAFDGRPHTRPPTEPTVDPSIAQSNLGRETPLDGPGFEAAVKAWSRFRFVRAGWLTAKEAIAYIDYFYTYLSPLTPIVVPDYRDHAAHAALLKEEPMLTVTILTIAARFMQLTGVGAVSRPYAIHEKLWKYLQGMIDRVIWGQEQFGGGFCGAGALPGCDVNPLSRKGLRTLGTVESLMLLTEWHPRALHFPPGDDDDSLMLPDPEDPETISGAVSPDLYKGVGGQRIDSWLEPCWRSDRMCWMLLSNALALSFEIGVFDETSEMEFEQENQALPRETVKTYYRRKNHLKQLLVIYVTQTSGRLGLTSMMPKVDRESTLKFPIRLFQQRMKDMLASPVQKGREMTAESLEELSKRCSTQDLVLDFWENIARIMERGNQEMFASRRRTRELIKTGNYVELLKSFQAPMHDWRRAFDATDALPTQLRHILTIEFEYTRVYLNSLALQAVVERCTHNSPLQTHAQSPSAPRGANRQTNAKQDGNGGAIPLSTIIKWYGNDRYYIDEVIDASRTVLKIVVEGLYPGDYLRHAPVRTFFRIVSVAIILLKTFALGATEDDVAISLGLMERAVHALRNNIVDDVHVGNRFADLLETITNRIRSRFVRMAPNGGSGISRAASRSPALAAVSQTQMMPPPQPSQHNQWSAYMGQNGSSNVPPAGVSTSLGNNGGRATPNHPLWGISTETYDPNNSNIAIMPPPSFDMNGPYGSNPSSLTPGGSGTHFGAGTLGEDTSGTYAPDWLAIPLDPLLNNYGADVTSTTFGPDVGGYDLLDVLLSMEGSA